MFCNVSNNRKLCYHNDGNIKKESEDRMAKLERKPKKNVKKITSEKNYNLLLIVLITIILGIFLAYDNYNYRQEKVEYPHIEKHVKTKIECAKKEAGNVDTQSNNMRKQINYQLSSETISYPKITKNIWIDVNIDKQRVYIMQGNKQAYEMYCSTGTKNEPTPIGIFHLQAQRGENFYNQKTKMGANYWTSFKEHGVYLFHTVPTDINGNYIIPEAQKLGKKAGSHGCIRLSIPDAKYIQTLPTGTPVNIQKQGKIPNYNSIINN